MTFYDNLSVLHVINVSFGIKRVDKKEPRSQILSTKEVRTTLLLEYDKLLGV